MKRIKIFWMIPWSMHPSIGDYFRIGYNVGKCVFKTPWCVVMWVPKGWGERCEKQ